MIRPYRVFAEIYVLRTTNRQVDRFKVTHEPSPASVIAKAAELAASPPTRPSDADALAQIREQLGGYEGGEVALLIAPAGIPQTMAALSLATKYHTVAVFSPTARGYVVVHCGDGSYELDHIIPSEEVREFIVPDPI